MDYSQTLRIVSDGTSHGTTCYDSEGRVIKGIASIEWAIVPRGLAVATLTFHNVALDVSEAKVQQT